MHFSSRAELIFALLMLPALAFFTGCILYLWRLLLNAARLRGRIITPVLQSGVGIGVSSETTELAQGEGEVPYFALLIPAHNEQMLLGAALDGLNRLEYPRDRYVRVVIADNCTDETAEIARRQGAIVLERTDPQRIGKGYALEWALRLLLQTPADRQDLEALPEFDAVVILDADTLTAPNLLREFAAALKSGEQAIQARYDVLNSMACWRTHLMRCALALAHVIKPLGRERLGLSDGLKGNGMCFAREVVERVPWSGESITEDIEYTLRLCRAGYRVVFLPETIVWAQMPTTGTQAASQRKRWEGGRYKLLFTLAPRLLSESIRSGNRLLRDRAFDLMIPPLAEMFALPCVLLCACALPALFFGWHCVGAIGTAWAILLILQAAYLLGGLWVARIPIHSILSLLYAPGYILWKFAVYATMAAGRSAGGWRRTERQSL